MPLTFARSLRVRILALLLGGCWHLGWANGIALSQEKRLPPQSSRDSSAANPIAVTSERVVSDPGQPSRFAGAVPAGAFAGISEPSERAATDLSRSFGNGVSLVEQMGETGAIPNAGAIEGAGQLVHPTELELTIPDWIDMAELKSIDGREVGTVPESGGDFDEDMSWDFEIAPLQPRYRIYREHASMQSYMPGDGDQFGWIDLETNPYLRGNQKSGWTTAIGLHLLSGPNAAPLPPRLWDFVLGYQKRETIEDRFSYDLAGNIGVYSDFEDSARDGVRTLGHAVGMFHSSDALDIVAGVDYLDRDDYKILPVIGFSWHGSRFPNLGIDLVFPRPRVQYALSSTERIYMAGLLGGGTWDIEMPGDINDVMTYRDFRILFGHEQLTAKGNLAALELGVVFGRKLEFRSLRPDLEFDDAFIIRLVSSR